MFSSLFTLCVSCLISLTGSFILFIFEQHTQLTQILLSLGKIHLKSDHLLNIFSNCSLTVCQWPALVFSYCILVYQHGPRVLKLLVTSHLNKNKLVKPSQKLRQDEPLSATKYEDLEETHCEIKAFNDKTLQSSGKYTVQ